MNAQEIIVGILVFCSLIWILKRILRNIKQIRNNEPPSCGCGCSNCPSAKSCSDEKK